MGKVVIVTDSTADLPRSAYEELGVRFVPLNVHFGEETFFDAVTMSSDEFFDKLISSSHHPRTSQPAPGDFLNLYRELADQAEAIVSIHLSSRLSGTYESAILAKSMLPGNRIEVIDGRSASMGTGLIVIEAAEAARQGLPVEEVVARARRVADAIKIYFAVDTLEYLRRNGRIGRAQAMLGNLLNIKPVLTLEDGLVAPLDKVRGRSKVLPRLVEAVESAIPPGRNLAMAVLHSRALEGAEALAVEIESRYRVVRKLVGQVGPVIGVHTGPGLVGVACYEA